MFTRNIIISALIGATALMGADLDDFSVGGHYLGGISRFAEGSLGRSQFDFAANLDFSYRISEKITGMMQLQTGAGDGTVGFVGPQTVLTDITLEYHDADGNLTITMGSFDTPFGLGTYKLTNNADSFNNALINNDLFYSALAGPVGTLNTLGIKVEKPLHPYLDMIAAVTNGTDETANNGGDAFEGILTLSSTDLIKSTTIAGSYLSSQDQDDPVQVNSNSTQSNINAWMAEIETTALPLIDIRGHVGNLSYGDNNMTTNDDVAFWMAEAKTSFIEDRYVVLRYSSWNPVESSRARRSTDLVNPGFQIFSSHTETRVQRYQFGGAYELENDLWAKAEFVYDDYDTAGDVAGVLLYLNGRF